MPVRVFAHGFSLSDALLQKCFEEVSQKLQPCANRVVHASWFLSVSRNEHSVHLQWSDGDLRGNLTVKSDDMYKSINAAARKARLQLLRSHDLKKKSQRYVAA